MISQEERIEQFTARINQTADKRVKKLEDAASQLLDKEVSALDAELEAKLQNRLKFEGERIRSVSNSEITALEAEAKRKISLKRGGISDAVFQQVEKRVALFAESDGYAEFLKRSMESFALLFKDKFSVFCRKCDVETVESIIQNENIDCTVSSDEGVVFGGLYASDSEGAVYVYDTLDSRIEKCRKEFLTIADLSV